MNEAAQAMSRQCATRPGGTPASNARGSRRAGRRFGMLASGLSALALVCAAANAGAGEESEAPTAEPKSCLRPFKVSFGVEWRGLSAGTSTLELTRRADQQYTYRSSNTARGFFRLALPDTITQTSEFSIVDGKVRPSRYVGDDGSDDTKRDVSLDFDWEAGRVTGVSEDNPVDEPIEPGVQDSLSVQIALMCALASGHSPTSFQLIDKDKVKEYQYRHEGGETLETPIGRLDTLIYTSQRAGSSRVTRLWVAPSLGYLPVRAEQVKKGKRELQFRLRSAERNATP